MCLQSFRVVGEPTGKKGGPAHYNCFYVGTELYLKVFGLNIKNIWIFLRYQVNDSVKFEDEDKDVLLGCIHCAIVDKTKKISCCVKLYSQQDEESKEVLINSLIVFCLYFFILTWFLVNSLWRRHQDLSTKKHQDTRENMGSEEKWFWFELRKVIQRMKFF